MNTFADFGLRSSLLKTLKSQKIQTPTQIQKMAIPLMMANQSVVGVSETGSGKTLTYALPVLHHLKKLEDENQPVTEIAQPRALILVPSRDLGEQVTKVFKNYTHDTRLRVRSALGGMTFEQIRRNVGSPFEILLATPGRMIQLIQKKLVNLSDVKYLIFDEADQMLDEGFIDESNIIAQSCPDDVSLALFSATVSNEVEELIKTLFSKAEVIYSSGHGKVVKSLITKNEIVIDGLRWPLFEKLLKQKVSGGTLVFTNTREQCDRLAEEMKAQGYTGLVYRGDMEKNDRRVHLKKFRNKEVDILISTDLAARGLDVDHVGRVINYHLPKQLDNYLHRAGRTARAGRSGLVVNLVTERDLELISKIDENKRSVSELKKLFKDKDGKRLHLPEDQRKPRLSKQRQKTTITSNQRQASDDQNFSDGHVKSVSKKTKPKSSFKGPPKFKPKPKPAFLLQNSGKNSSSSKK